jgi:hypothetical protein
MATQNAIFPGNVTATSSFYGSGSGLSANTVPRASVVYGTIGYPVINSDSTGAISEEQYLHSKRGGSGVDLSSASSTGVVRMTGTAPNKTFSVGNVVDGDVAVGTFAWNKLVTKTPLYVAVTDSGGALTAAASITVAQGGTGQTSVTGMLKGNGASAITGVTTANINGVSYWSDANTIAALSPATTGQILKGVSSGIPAFDTPNNIITSGTGLTWSLPNTLGLTIPVVVSSGGTGAITLTGVVKGNGASAMTACTGTQYGVTYWTDANTISGLAAGATGNLLKGNTGAAPSFDTPNNLISAGTGLTWSTSNTLGLSVPVGVANGGTGAITLTGMVKGNGAGAFTAATGTQYGVAYWSTTSGIGTSNAGTTGTILKGVTTAAPSFDTPNNVITAGTGLTWSASSTLALSTPVALANGGTNASLTADGSLVKVLQLAASATAVNLVTASAIATASSYMLRDSGGSTRVNAILNVAASGASSTAPSENGATSHTSYISTASGSSTLYTVTSAQGYAGTIKCIITVASAANASDYGTFEITWRWRRATGQALELNTTPAMKLVDKSNVATTYDVTAASSANNVVITVAHGNAGATLYWCGKFKLVHARLS